MASLKVMHSTAMQSMVEASHLQVFELKQQLQNAHAVNEELSATYHDLKAATKDQETVARANATMLEKR